MRIVEDRSLGDGELVLALAADVQDARRYRTRLHFACFGIDDRLLGGGIFDRAESGLLDVFRYLLTPALQALNAFGPAHLFEEIVAGFRSSELFCYVYQD